jgi:membrane peptidoglycan carboxypeptidase
MGITSELSPYPIITLGTENVTPLEMAAAYGTLANGGIKHNPVVITKIVDKNGNTLYESADEGERVLDEKVAGAVTDTLRGVFESSSATAYGAGPYNGQPVAGKTGTGVEFRDHWLVGYSPTLCCSAWIGNRDYSSTSESLTANSLWQNFMSEALAGEPIVQFPVVEEPEYRKDRAGAYDDEEEEADDEEKSEESENADSENRSDASASAEAADASQQSEDTSGGGEGGGGTGGGESGGGDGGSSGSAESPNPGT